MARSAVLIALAAFVSTAAFICTAGAQEQAEQAEQAGTYSPRYDDVDVEAILSNPALVDRYAACFVADTDVGCDAVARDVKAVLSEALPGNCARCTEKQKAAMTKVVSFLAKERPELWQQVQQKFDPDNNYAAANPQLFQ